MNSKNAPLMSVIVPVYNVEKYLRQCLDSIIDQTLEEIEIILIDDGSTDSSGSICDEYAAMDNRIVLIHKENAGLGAAYNTGLEIAKGEYIGFVESDDWVELNMFEELYNKAREFDVDVVKSNFFDYNSVRQIDRKRHNLESLVPENIVFKIEEYPQIFSMHSSIWAGLYKKSFLIKEKIKFPTTKSASYQDFYFNTLVLMKANIVITYEHFLHYRQEFGHLSSIARKDKMLLMFIEQFKNVYHVIKDYYNYKNIESYFFNSGFRTCYHFYNQIMDAYKIIFFNQLAEVVQNFKGIDTTILNEHSLKFYKRLNRKNCAKNYDIKVSIIVPVYNVEKYLRQCLDSIIDQTLEEIEIILIDDGSTDSSGSICDEYAAMDNRIVLIHKENAGLGAAYNTGLEIAKGEYIGFVESDDWVELNMFEELYNKAREFDVDVVKSLYFDYKNGTNRLIDKFSKFKSNIRLTNPVDTPEILFGHVSHWSSIYKKSFLKNNNINFHNTPGAASQDFGFAFKVFSKMNNCYIIKNGYYHYRIDNPDSSVNQIQTISIKVMNEFILTYDFIQNFEKNIKEVFAKHIYISFINNYRYKCKNIKSKYIYIKISNKLFKKLLNKIDFTLFNREQKDTFILVAKTPNMFLYKSMLFSTEKSKEEHIIKILNNNVVIYHKKQKKGDRLFKIFGITLSSGKTINKIYTKKILGMSIFKKDFRTNKIIKKYPFFHIESAADMKKIKFLKYIPLYYKQDIKGDRLFKIFGITLSSGKTINKIYTKKILGMSIFKKDFRTNKIIKKYPFFHIESAADMKKIKFLKYIPLYYKQDIKGDRLFKIFGITLSSGKTINNVYIRKILGIPVFTKILEQNTKSIHSIEKIELLQTICLANAIQDTHQNTFLQFKNFHEALDVYIIAAGETLNYFKYNDKNSKYIGVNSTFLYNNLILDYIFFQDAEYPRSEFVDALNKYNAVKFYGILQDSIKTEWIVSESDALLANAKRYYVISQWKYPPVKFTYDIANQPLGCAGSIVFAAIQFALYTNPRRIFLVGCDTSNNGYFTKKTNAMNIKRTFDGFLKIKEFANCYYPKTQIISINPIGLKGLFKDLYTQDFLNKYNLSGNNEIFEKYIKENK